MSCLSSLSAGRLSSDSGCQNWFFPVLPDIRNRVVDVFKFKGFSTLRFEMRLGDHFGELLQCGFEF